MKDRIEKVITVKLISLEFKDKNRGPNSLLNLLFQTFNVSKICVWVGLGMGEGGTLPDIFKKVKKYLQFFSNQDSPKK
jgi:hypothetical protein